MYTTEHETWCESLFPFSIRFAQSVVLNIAEARGNDAGNARARFSTACGSAKEVRAALNVASDWGYIEGHTATRLDEKLDEVCAITWCLGRRR
jgi:four helix bundle protein